MNPDKVNSKAEKITALFTRARKHRRNTSWRIAKDLPISFYYAFQGITYAFASQRNFRIQACLGAFVLSFGIAMGVNAVKLAVIIFIVSLVLTLELINTSIEATVDLAIGQRFHPLARIAKDCAAAAVLIASISSLMVALILLLPPFLTLLGL